LTCYKKNVAFIEVHCKSGRRCLEEYWCGWADRPSDKL